MNVWNRVGMGLNGLSVVHGERAEWRRQASAQY